MFFGGNDQHRSLLGRKAEEGPPFDEGDGELIGKGRLPTLWQADQKGYTSGRQVPLPNPRSIRRGGREDFASTENAKLSFLPLLPLKGGRGRKERRIFGRIFAVLTEELTYADAA